MASLANDDSSVRYLPPMNRTESPSLSPGSESDVATVAIVSSVPVFPTLGGNRVRILEFAKALKELGHQVHFIYLPQRRQPIDIQAHEDFFGCQNFHRLSNGGVMGAIRQWIRGELRSKLRNGLQAYCGLRGWYYSGLDDSYNPNWNGQIRRIAAGVDVAIVEYVFNTRAFEGFSPETLRVLDTHDSFAERHVRYAGRGLRTGYWISLRAGCEAEGFLRADRVIAIQEGEAELFRGQLEGKARQPEVLAISHFPAIHEAVPDYSKDRVATFVGSDNPANRQAIASFAMNILPLIRARIPDFRLIVAGKISDFAKSFEGIECTGFVQEVGSVYRRAPLSINPILSGTGVAIKLLDAMSHGVSSVTTETGARGIPPQYLVGNIVVPDSDHAGFAAAVVRACSDAGLRTRMGTACHEAAKAWRRSQLSLLQGCLARRGFRA